jgi:hypothetical protein
MSGVGWEGGVWTLGWLGLDGEFMSREPPDSETEKQTCSRLCCAFDRSAHEFAM